MQYIISLILLIFLNCASRKNINPEVIETVELKTVPVSTPDVMSNFADELELFKSGNFGKGDFNFENIQHKFSQLLKQEIVIASEDSLVLLESKLIDFSKFLDFVRNYADLKDNSALLINTIEFQFIFLIGAQTALEKQMLSMYSHEKIAWMLEYISINRKFSETKTALLNQLFTVLQSVEMYSLNEQGLHALENMLKRIDISGSESGNQLIQRSAEGLMISKGDVTSKFANLSKWISDNSTLELANGISQIVAEGGAPSREPSKLNIEIELKDLPKTKTEYEIAADYFYQAYNTNDNSQKIQWYSKAIQANPEFSPSFYNRGVAYYELKRYAEAVKDFNQALKLEPQSPAVYYYRAVCYQKMDSVDLALANFDTAIQREKYPVDALLGRAHLFQDLEQYDNAIREYSRVIDLNSVNEDAYLNRGFCYQITKRTSLAISDYRTVLGINPENINANYNLGSIYWERSDWKRVIELWENCLRIDPEFEPALENLPTARVNAIYKNKKIKRTYIYDERKIRRK